MESIAGGRSSSSLPSDPFFLSSVFSISAYLDRIFPHVSAKSLLLVRNVTYNNGKPNSFCSPKVFAPPSPTTAPRRRVLPPPLLFHISPPFPKFAEAADNRKRRFLYSEFSPCAAAVAFSENACKTLSLSLYLSPLYGVFGILIVSWLPDRFSWTKMWSAGRNPGSSTSIDNGLFEKNKRQKTNSSAASASASASANSSSQSLPIGDYEVFLNFRGPDTRDEITGILHHFLVKLQIRTFKDDDDLRKGESIWPNLVKAIQESKIYVPVFSETYAYSKWCLKELAKIVEHQEKNGECIILPIFYMVDPSDVRHQSGPYQMAFQQHEQKNVDKETIGTWKEALSKVGALDGWHVKSKNEKIATADLVCSSVWSHLMKSHLVIETGKLFGIDDHIKLVMDKMSLDSGGATVLGIHGTGGIGKTTVATAVYNKLCTQFGRCSFLDDGTDRVEGIRIHQDSYMEELGVSKECFMKLSQLRYLDINARMLIDDFNNYVPNLRWLRLKMIDGGWMPKFSVEHLMASNLKVLKLSGHWLHEFPEFPRSGSLEILELENRYHSPSEKDRDIDWSDKGEKELDIGNLGNLKVLRLRDGGVREITCETIRMMPLEKRKVLHLLPSSLTTLHIIGCPQLEWLPNLENLENLTDFSIEDCPLVKEILGLGGLKSLETLSISGLKDLCNLDGLDSLCSLKSLSLNCCFALERLPSMASLSKLLDLSISSCSHLTEIQGLGGLGSLQMLFIQGANSLSRLFGFETLLSLNKLGSLEIRYCPLLTLLPFHGLDSECPSEALVLNSLRRLFVSETTGPVLQIFCRMIQLLMFPNLTVLVLIGDEIGITDTELQLDGLESMEELVKLHLYNLRSIRRLPSLSMLVNLESLVVINLPNLQEIDGLAGLKSLEELCLIKCTSLERLPVDQFYGLEQLKKLKVKNVPRLRLMEGLAGLKSLKELSLIKCTSLERLPADQLYGLEQLKMVDIYGCTNLTLTDLSALRELEPRVMIEWPNSISIHNDPFEDSNDTWFSYTKMRSADRNHGSSTSIDDDWFEKNKRQKSNSVDYASSPHWDVAASAPPSANSSLQSPPWGEYEVFLNYRGQDTRYQITDILYRFLVNLKIRTFKDDDELRNGEGIWPSLAKAIEQSKIYVTIFSENYAYSKWCLRELAAIVKRLEHDKCCIILPIFYMVDPKDVRNQSGPYQNAFDKHGMNFDQETIEVWKDALNRVGSLKGWHAESSNEQGAIADLVTGIVLSHLSKKNNVLEIDKLIGIDADIKAVKEIMTLGSGGVSIVGIHGIGGIGKTTIAKAVFNKVSAQFDRCSFVENVREMLHSKDGVITLQKHLVSDILRRNFVESIANISEAGLPLTLKVVGSLLFKEEEVIWKDKLRRLKEIPEEKVVARLKISYDALSEDAKRIFLDIACFFIGEDKEMASYMWSDCGLFPTTNINILIQRSMIDIVFNDYHNTHLFRMHDQLRDMGREIVCRENITRPWKRSRIWSRENALEMLRNGKGTKQVEGIRLHYGYDFEGKLGRKECFMKLSELRYLDMQGVKMPIDDFSNYVPNLRWLRLSIGVLSIPKFSMENLVILELFTWLGDESGALKQIKMASKLKVLKLSCGSLDEFPEFSRSGSLEILDVETSFFRPPWWVRTDLDIGNLRNLKVLRLKNCWVMRNIRAGAIGMMPFENLKVLHLEGCWVTEITGGTVGMMPFENIKVQHLLPSSLTTLLIIDCPKLEWLPNLENLENLSSLSIVGCPLLREILGLGGLKSLEAFSISDLKALCDMEGLGSLYSLKSLSLKGCDALTRLPSMASMSKLLHLYVSSCPCLTNIQGLGGLELLQMLHIHQAMSLSCLIGFETLLSLNKLKVLKISDCPLLTLLTFYGIDDGCRSQAAVLDTLQELDIHGTALVLQIFCRMIQMLMFPSLTVLKLSGVRICSADTGVELDGVESMEELVDLQLYDLASIRRLPSLSKLRNLKNLKVANAPNLQEIAGLAGLKSLERLDLTGCTSLEKFPADELSDLQQLKTVIVSGCTNLIDRSALRELEPSVKIWW
ncbi:unnamed protein product [Linum tenue]|uniref:TIR domain-containing protein n=1 Tax=Linum tenue TaxID=586396 RepID=A0AAV0JU72_9ROSI|nr:unnamed protein product [Linum tenue]